MVAAGGYHTLGLKTDGTVVAVGWNEDGQCNVGSWYLNWVFHVSPSIWAEIRGYCRSEPPSLSCHCERSVATSLPPTEIASADFFSLATREAKRLALLYLTRTERGGVFSRREDGPSRLVGAGFNGTGYMGNEAARQRSRVYARANLHNCLSCGGQFMVVSIWRLASAVCRVGFRWPSGSPRCPRYMAPVDGTASECRCHVSATTSR